MLAITAPLKARLQALPALAGWDVRTGTEAADRRLVPSLDVRCTGAAVPSVKGGGVMLAPEWTLTLAVRRSVDAAGQIDTALAAVIESLHGWQPGQHGGRGWEPLQLARASEAQYADEGLAGYEIAFTTAATYMGQQ